MEEGFPYDDAHLEARRGGLKVKEPKDLVCQSNNKIQKMCVKSSCQKKSLFCDKKECPSCRDQHRKCLQVNLEGITESMNKHIPTKNKIIEQVGAIESKFFNSLRETSSRLGEEIRFAGLGEKEIKIAEQIYDKSNANFLKGKEAAQFYQNIEQYEEKQPSMDNIQKLLSQYDKTLQNVLERAADVKKLLCNQFSSKAAFNNINSNLFDSKILSMGQGHTEVLNKIINETRKVQRVEKLFRASENAFKASAFHQKCDHKEDTLVLIRTELGKNIGGYTHYPWDSASGWLNDSERRAFIFSLDMGEKFVPQRDNSLIYRDSTYGPIFGTGNDIGIFDDCNNSNSSFVNFPNIYNRAGGNKLVNNKDTYRMFSGGDTYNFKVVEYEVFQLFYE